VLGVIGVVAAFGLFFLAERVFHLDRAQAQTMMYLKLSVAGHLTIFLTRTRGPFWSIKPAKILWMAVLGTQIVATLIAVYGLFMTPLGWGWAGFVWGYALVWFLINDRIKLLAYRIFDRTKSKSKTGTAVLQKTEDKDSSTPESKNQPKADAKPDVKAPVANDKKEESKPEVNAETKTEPAADSKEETKPEVKAETKPDTKAETKPEPANDSKEEPKPNVKAEAKPADTTELKPEVKTDTPADLNPEIAKRAYVIFEKRSHQDGPAISDWEQAKLEMEIDKLKAASLKETKVAEPKVEASTEPKPIEAAATKSQSKEDAAPKTKDGPAKDSQPPTVQRVHKLYEELGREDVKEAQDWDNAQKEKQEHETHE
jgi:H+-transporting ATPase